MVDRLKAGLLAAAAALLHNPAHAQSDDFFDLPPEHLAKLKVTAASAFTETVLDASATVSVVNRSDWEQRAARNLADAVMHLPGIMLLPLPTGGQLIQVRSYDSTSLRGRATLLDGVPINTFAFGTEAFSNSRIQLPVLDSLELVRGPSSILYGSDAFHSALVVNSYNSKLPELSIGSELGSDNYRSLSMRFNDSVGSGQQLQAALAASHQGAQEDTFDYQTGSGLAQAERDRRYDAGSGMVRWQGGDSELRYQLQLFTDYLNTDQFPGGGTVTGDTRNFDIADKNSMFWMVKGQLAGEFGALWGWQWDNYYWHNDYGQTFYLPTLLGMSEEVQQFVEFRYGSKAQLTRTGIEAGGARTDLAFNLGVERAGVDDHDFRRRRIDGGPISQSYADYEGLSQTIRSAALEGKSRWHEGRWQLIYGGRVDDYSTFGAEFSPRLGLIWMPTSSSSVRLLYGEAFRAPNANELRGTNFFAGSTALNPETLQSHELAFAHVRGRWQLELVLFQNHWEERILLAADATAPLGRRYTNVGESESEGVELSVNYTNGNWRIEVSAASIDNKNIDTGAESTAFPDWMANLGVGYRWPTQRLQLFWSNHLHDGVRVGDQALLPTQTLEDAPLFWRSDLTLKQQWGSHWSGTLALRNLIDRDNVWPSVVNSRGGIDDIPRQVSIGVEYRGPW
jgi:iron complex outermembrane receptor protein